MSTLAEQVVEQLKTDMDNVYDAGYQKGLKEVGGLDVSKFGIQNEVTGTSIVTCDYVNENEHNVEVKLSSDTVTDFSGVEVVTQSNNFFDISKFVSSANRTNNGDGTITLKTYGVDVKNKLSECCPNIKVGQTISISLKGPEKPEESVIYFGDSAYAINMPLTVTQAMLDKDWFDFYGSRDGEIVISDVIINPGNVDKPYVPYFTKTYTANADGTVDDVTCIHPNMNIICEGVDITAKYYCVTNVEWNRLWDVIQSFGIRTDYTNAFYGKSWTPDIFEPKYDIVPTSATQMFGQNVDAGMKMISMKELEEKQGVIFDFSNCVNMGQAFRDSMFNVLNVIDLKTAKQNIRYLFYSGITRDAQVTNGSGLKRIERLICYDTNIFETTTFQNCYILEYVGFEGVIATSIDLHWSSMLVNESVQKLVECLKDLTGQTTQTVTLHPEVEARMSAEQKAIITSKNWTLAVANA